MNTLMSGVWWTDDVLRLMGGVRFPGGMIVLRTSANDLVVVSATQWTMENENALRSIAPVRAFIVPNLMHHLFVGRWLERFPHAELYAPERLSKKRPELKIAKTLAGTEEVAPGITAIPIGGAPQMNELAFFHEASGSLTLTDLMFNVRRTPTTFGRVYMTMTNSFGRPACSRVWRFLIKDKAAARRSFDEIAATGFTSIVPSHGEPIVADARESFRRELAWV